MKNLMVVDRCQDYGFDVHRVSDEEFSQLMSGSKGRVAFIEDIYEREDYDALFPAFQRMWYGRIRNESVDGVDGLLFYENIERKKAYSDHRIDCTPISYSRNSASVVDTKHVILFDAEPSRKICPYAVSKSVFDMLFPGPGANLVFAEDIVGDRMTAASFLMDRLRGVKIEMKEIKSISGIIYYGYPEWRDKYPLRNDAEMARHYPLID